MNLAIAVRERAKCLGTRVGAVLVLEDRVIATGYNGTPSGMPNCDEGGCERCANRGGDYPPGSGYDQCICVHAEQNTLLTSARFGIGVDGSILYTTMRPCFGCTKELLQARVKGVHYLDDWTPRSEVAAQYRRIQERFEGGVHRLPDGQRRKEWGG